jgi:hypothetical protein
MTQRGDGHPDEAAETAHQPGQPPVIEDHLLPTMAPVARIRARSVADVRGPRMENRPAAAAGGHGRMEPVGKRAPKTPVEPGEGRRGEQRASGGQAMAESGVSYVRLRLHNEGGTLSIVGAKEVPGPLTVPDYVGTGLIYEVLAENRRIGLGSLPDPNVRRAFTNFDQKEAALGHNETVLDSYDFDVRVPKSELSAAALPRIAIQLHQVGTAPPAPLGRQALREQLGDAARPVAALEGINLDDLEPDVRAELATIVGTEELTT